MESELTMSKLADIADVIDSLHKTPKYSDSGYPMVRCVNLRYGSLELSNTRFVSEKIFNEYSCKYTPKIGDIIITRVGANFGVTSYVEETNFCLGQNTAAIVPTKINHRYLYYILNSVVGRQQMDVLVAGAAQPTLSLKAIKNLNIPRLGDEIEDEIANAVGALDDKIKLNRQMNETLEGMAQALFKSWFVDFDPVIDDALASGKEIPTELSERAAVRAALGDKRQPLPEEIRTLFPNEFTDSAELGWLPKGWEACIIGNELETILGGTPARKNKDFWNEGSIPWINSGKVNEFRVIEPSELITEDALKKSATKLLPKRTTLLAITGATLGQVSINEIECCANQSVVGIVGNEKFPNEYIYLWIQSTIGKIISSQTGGAQQHINKANVNEANILLPNRITLDYFSAIVAAYFDNIASNCFSIQTLTKLRDTLLPKLLSGEIRIPEAGKMVEGLAL